MIARAFTEAGRQRFKEYLIALREDPKLSPPWQLLEDDEFAKVFEGSVTIDQVSFASKLDAGRYLCNVLKSVSLADLQHNVDFWAWLTLLQFDSACPIDGNGRRKRLSIEKYLPDGTDYRRGPDKHLLFFPWKMYRLHKEAARHILMGPLHKDSRAQREWTGYEYNVCTTLVEIADEMYYDAEQQKLRRGATGKLRGNLRSYTRFLNQVTLTYDIWGMEAPKMLRLMPRAQFGRFLPDTSADR